MYNGNVKLVDDLLERKRSENMVKEHPDFPDYPSMNLYWVPLVAYGNVQIGQKPIFLIKTTRFPRWPLCLAQVLLDLSTTNKDISSEKVTMDLTADVDPGASAPWYRSDDCTWITHNLAI